jgi:tetratricopeptide (TPR) repeat protein
MKGLFRISAVAALAVTFVAANPAFAPPPGMHPIPHPEPRPEFRPRPGMLERPGGLDHVDPRFTPEPRRGFEEPFSPDVANRARSLIEASRPVEAIDRIHRGRDVLEPGQRVELTRRAVDELARASEGGDPAARLPEVREVAAQVRDLDPELGRSVEALEARLAERLLTERVESLGPLVDKGQWSDAAARAREQLPQQDLPAEWAKTLKDVVRLDQRVQDLDYLESALGKAERDRPDEIARSLRQASVERSAPDDLAEAARGLSGVFDLKAVAEFPLYRAPDVGRLQQSISALQATHADPKLLQAVQLELSCKVFLDGFPAEARLLLPATSSPEQAGALLRDLKAMALGEGKVSTWPAGRAPGGPGQPPPGLKLLLPEGEARGWHLPVRESSLAGLPPAAGGREGPRPERAPEAPGRSEKPPRGGEQPREAARRAEPEALVGLEKPLREKMTAALRTEHETLRREGDKIRHALHQRHQQQVQADEDWAKLLAELEALLGRKLSPAERCLAWYLWRHKGQKASAIAATLLRASSGAATAWNQVGLAHHKKGNYDQAIAAFTEAIRLEPRRSAFHARRGDTRCAQGAYQKAIADYTEAIRLDPRNDDAYNGRGDAYRDQRDYDRAIADYTEAIRLFPNNGAYHRNRGVAHSGKGAYDTAIEDFTTSIRLVPGDAEVYLRRANAYDNMGDYAKVMDDFSDAILLEPRDGGAWNSLAWLLATCPDAKVRDGPKAVEYATRACELSSWKGANHLDTLAAAYAEVGKFDEAVRWQEKALDLPGWAGPSRERARQRLALYREGKPYRRDKAPAPRKTPG